MATEHLVVSYFSRSAVLTTAERDGLLREAGLEVEAVPVRSSPHQFTLLRDGACDLALTSPDNVVAYREGVANPLGEQLDVCILMALDRGLGLSVLGAPGVGDLGDLAGKVVGVDVASSGFALALFGLLEARGLTAGRDYELRELGATPARRQALLAGSCDATLLNAGHDLLAEAAGCRRLARVVDRYAPYLGAVLCATGPWLDAHLDQAAAFVGAWRGAVEAVVDPDRRADATAATVDAGLPEQVAGAFVEVMASPTEGLVRGGAVEPAALQTVLDLRAGSAGAPAPAGLVDARALAGA